MKNPYPFSGVLVRFKKEKSPVDTTSGDSIPLAQIADAQNTELAPKPGSENKYGNELHVNIWDFESEAIVDIGLMVHKSEVEEILSICIDIPWHISKQNVFDVATKIDGERILEAIFNRDVGYKSDSNSRNPRISFTDESAKDFLLVRLNNTAFEVEDVLIPGGQKVSRIVLKPDFKLLEADLKSYQLQRYYFRLRLLQVPRKVFSIHFTQRDRNLLSSCIEETVLDFRLNPRRGIPPEILYPSDSEFVFPTFEQMHLFLIAHRDRQPTFQSKNFKTCRSLEDENVWNEYIRLDGNGNEHHHEEVKNYLGYQWSEARVKGLLAPKELVALGRFSRVSSDSWTMFRFVIIALLFGAASNGLWTVWENLSKDVWDVAENAQLSRGQDLLSILSLIVTTVVLAFLLNFLFWLLSKCVKRLVRWFCKYFCRRR